MSFAPGDRVHLPRLGTGVVLEIRSGGRIVVEIKGRKTVVDERQIKPAAPARGGTTQATPPPEDSLRATAAASIDLHGQTVEQAMETLDAFINDALLAGHAEVRVIHGRSGGRIRDAAHARLRALPPVKSIRLDPRNPGVTIVSL